MLCGIFTWVNKSVLFPARIEFQYNGKKEPRIKSCLANIFSEYHMIHWKWPLSTWKWLAIFNPFLFIRGLSYPSCIQAFLSLNCLKLTMPGFPYNCLPICCGDIGFLKKILVLVLAWKGLKKIVLTLPLTAVGPLGHTPLKIQNTLEVLKARYC